VHCSENHKPASSNPEFYFLKIGSRRSALRTA
jgi:hypothetical protein